MNTLKSILLILLFLGNVIISLYTFTNGFLIRRVSLNHTNTNSFEKLKKFDKAIILFIDALRFDFIFTNHENKQNDYFGLPTIEALIKKRSNARLYKFIADPPTTTMQRIKALMSGTLPTFIDAGSNFDSYIIEDDTLIKQGFKNNKSIVILGDDTWLSLFESHMIKQHHTYPSFNIKDLDTNDMAVDEHLENLFKHENNIKWDLLIAHYLGLDHCGHSFGPKSPVIKRKLKDIDNSIKSVYEKMDNSTLLVIIGDHGMTETGDHGGDSRLELETALFFYSKKKIFNEIDTKDSQSTRKLLFNEIRQINLTPTLALALGIPIPYSNLGIAILDIFENEKMDAIKANFLQVEEFIKRYQFITGEEFIGKEELEEFHFQKMSNTSEQILLNYLNLIQEKCREKWSTFNLNYCISGLALIFLSILSLLVFLNVLSESPNTDDIVFEKLSVNLAKNFAFIFVFYLILIILANIKLSSSTWILSLFFSVNVLFKFKNQFYKISILIQFFRNCLFRKDYLIIYLSFLIPFSNSFVIRENNSLRFLLITFIFLDLYSKLCVYKLSWSSFLVQFKKIIVIIFFVRFSFVFYVCREELSTLNCTQTMFSTPFSKLNLIENSNFFIFLNNTVLHYSLFLLFNFICFVSIFRMMISNVNLKIQLINVNIKQLFHLKIFILFIYIFIQLKLNINNNLNSDDSIKLNNLLKSINLFLAKLVYILFLFVQIIIWYPRTELDMSKSVFSETRIKCMVLSLCLVLTMLMGESFLSIWILILIIVLYINYTKSWSSNNLKTFPTLDPLVFMLMLQYYYFYATGHETTFTFIKWEAGFHGFDGDNNNKFVRFIMALMILGNTFSSHIITSMSIGLIFFSINDLKQKNEIFKNYNKLIFKFLIISTTKIFFGAVSVFVLRRHLMVWKIFAPRFVFELIGFLVSTTVCNFSVIFLKKLQ